MAFLYTNNEKAGRETRTKIPFTMATRKIKYLKIKLTKELKDLDLENYRTLRKELKEVTSESIYRFHGLEDLTSWQCSYYPKQSIDSMQCLVKYQRHISQI